jgi:hypothetical protein
MERLFYKADIISIYSRVFGKKKLYFFFNRLKKNFASFFWKLNAFYVYEINVSGMKFNPKILPKIFECKKYKYKNLNLHLSYLPIFTNKKFHINNINVSIFFRFHLCNKYKKKQNSRFPSYSIYEESDIIFEETADKLKFLLDINFVQKFLFQNSFLGSCLINIKSSFNKMLKFWKLYVTSCYNSMIKNRKIFKPNNYKKSSSSYLPHIETRVLDLEFFFIKPFNKIHFLCNYFKFLKTVNNFFLDSNLSFSHLETDNIRWRNRGINKFMAPKCRKFSMQILMTRLVLIN